MFPLSIIIPSYNRASQVDKTLQSLTRQSRQDFQVILVDHGSNDNTEEVAARYKDRLHLAYYKIGREDERFSAAVPRIVGVGKADTPIVAFIDTGMILPAQYVDAHIVFHQQHPNYVGIGLQHGLDLQFLESGEDMGAFLNKTEDLDLASEVLTNAQLRDRREAANLATSNVPWFYGWTANLSMSRDAYQAAGGFDLELKGWGFEDVDLCYRLSKRGQKFAFVENGWGIELPQPRKPMKERLVTHLQNMLQCFSAQKSLALETLILRQMLLQRAAAAYMALPTTDKATGGATIHNRMRSDFGQQAEEIFDVLSELGQINTTLPAITLPADVQAQFVEPTLFIGGTNREAETYNYVTIGDESVISTPSIWSCCGILIPQPDQALGTVVVSDIWKKCDWSHDYPFGMRSSLLLEVLVSEIARTAKEAIFLHSSSVTGLSIELLENLCRAHNLPYRIAQINDQQSLKEATFLQG